MCRTIRDGVGVHRNGPFLVVALVVATIAVIWTAIGLYALERRAIIFDGARHELTGVTEVLNAHAARTIDTVTTTLVAVETWLHETSRRAPQPQLSSITGLLARLGDVPSAATIRPVDSEERLFRFTEDGFRADIGDREYIRTLRNAEPGTVYISTPVVSRDSQRLILPIATRVRPNGYGISYLVAAVALTEFEAAYRSMLISAPAKVGIARETGELLVTVPMQPELIGRPVPDFASMVAHPDGRPSSAQLARDRPDGTTLAAYSYLTGRPLVVFVTFEKRDLLRAWRDQITPLLAAGSLVSVCAILLGAWIRRLMHLKERESENVQRALDAANRAIQAKRTFLANMSHELRSPLNAILGFSEIIHRQMLGPVPEYCRSYAGDINSSGDHLLHLVNQLLDVSRIESGAIQVEPKTCDVGQIIDDAVSITRPQCTPRNIAIQLDTSDAPLKIVSDPGIVRQVLVNILANAARHNRDNGTIRITACPADERLRIVVEDTGHGIPRDRLEGVFEPFSVGDSWVARDSPATELGLPIARALLRLLGGGIALDSEEGRGTRVELDIPRVCPAGPVAFAQG